MACGDSAAVAATIPNSGFLGVYAERMEKDVLPLLRSPEMKTALANPSANARRFDKASRLYVETTSDVWSNFETSAKYEPCVIATETVMDRQGVALTSGGRFVCIQEVGIYQLAFTGRLGEKTRGLDSGGNKIYVGDTVLLTTSEEEVDYLGRPINKPDGCAKNSRQWGFFSLDGKSSLPGGMGLTGQPFYCVDGKVNLLIRGVTAESFVVVCEQKDCVAAELLKRAATKGASSSAQPNVSTAPALSALTPAPRKKNKTLLGEWAELKSSCAPNDGDKYGNLVIAKDGMRERGGIELDFRGRGIDSPVCHKERVDIEEKGKPDRSEFVTLQLQEDGSLIMTVGGVGYQYNRCNMPTVPPIFSQPPGDFSGVAADDWAGAAAKQTCP